MPHFSPAPRWQITHVQIPQLLLLKLYTKCVVRCKNTTPHRHHTCKCCVIQCYLWSTSKGILYGCCIAQGPLLTFSVSVHLCYLFNEKLVFPLHKETIVQASVGVHVWCYGVHVFLQWSPCSARLIVCSRFSSCFLILLTTAHTMLGLGTSLV